MVKRAWTQRVLAAVLIGLLAAIAGVLLGSRGASNGQADASRPRSSPSQFDGPTLPPGLHAANFSLRDELGHRVSLSRYRGKVVVLTFIHSKCKDTCPFMVEQIKGALNLLPRQGSGVPAIGVSVAPAEDTPQSRLAFLRKHDMVGRLAFLGGSRAQLAPIWHAYAIQPVQGNIDHSTFVLLIDKKGMERVGFPADELTPEGLAHDIAVLDRESA